MSGRLLTRDELRELQADVELRIDEKLEELMSIEDVKHRKARAKHGLYGQLQLAESWLDMMCRCVHSDEAIISLTDDVSVTLWDAHIDVPK